MTHFPTRNRLACLFLFLTALGGCRSAESYRHEADAAARTITHEAQQQALGRTEPIEIRTPLDTLRRRLLLDQHLPVAAPASFGTHVVPLIAQFPDPTYRTDAPATESAPWASRPADQPLRISLVESLQIAARNSRTFQTEKEKVYAAALALDLERDDFRGTWTAVMKSEAVADLTSGTTEATLDHSAELKLVQKFKNGVEMTASLGLNLVRLMTGQAASSLGQFADGSISIPLLRGAGSFVVTEPLRQSERDVIYAVWTFERFKQTFAVEVVRAALGVLEQADAVHNTEESYRRVIASTRRARRLADAGRLPEIQVDQALQDELRARDRWIGAIQNHARRQDEFRQLLGLPPDAAVDPDPAELERLVAALAPMFQAQPAPETAGADPSIVLQPPDREHRGALELPEPDAIRLALDRRLDLRIAIGRIDDAQRKIAVAADRFLPDLTLLGQVHVGDRRTTGAAGQPDTSLHLDRGVYTGLLTFDPALERTQERNEYRLRLIDLEETVRAAQESEDQVKAQVRDTLRTLLTARESARTQERALAVARRRVASTNLFLEAGRAEIRDLLEAQESLVSAENARTSAQVRYRVAELELQRDLGVLSVTADGLWREFDPRELHP